jgi:hypothetical protein
LFYFLALRRQLSTLGFDAAKGKVKDAEEAQSELILIESDTAPYALSLCISAERLLPNLLLSASASSCMQLIVFQHPRGGCFPRAAKR